MNCKYIHYFFLSTPPQTIILWPASMWAMSNLADFIVLSEILYLHLHIQSIKFINPYSIYNDTCQYFGQIIRE